MIGKPKWRVLRIYDVDLKPLNSIMNMCVNSLACVRVKRGESECFRIGRGVRQSCIIFP